MYRFAKLILTFLIPCMVNAQSNIRIQIDSLPQYHPAAADIYVAGSFNGWNPQDNDYKFERDSSGNYFLPLKLDNGSYEFKITRGSWDKSEAKKGGGTLPNRKLTVAKDDLVHVSVAEWADRFEARPVVHSASRQVRIIDTAFLIPQLKRVRRIWVYLPEEYPADKSTKYPVLYMHDGQNLFDDATAYSGEWGIDEFLDSTTLRKCIVVGIDHGGTKRLNEYNPYSSEKFGVGEGDRYLEFLVRTLKPYIDKNFQTLRDKSNTFVAGSSMGGLISMYALLRYPTVFGGAGVFSPAFWITGDSIANEIKSRGSKVNSKIYFYAGKLEGESMVPDMLAAYESMKSLSKSKMVRIVNEAGTHSEKAWRSEFPKFYEWMIGASTK